jgi:hypothetical protein
LTSRPVGDSKIHQTHHQWSAGDQWPVWNSAKIKTEAAWFPGAGRLVVLNNDGTDEATAMALGDGRTTRSVQLAAHGRSILSVRPGLRGPPAGETGSGQPGGHGPT